MGSRRDEGGGFLRSVGGEPAEEQRGGAAGDARRQRRFGRGGRRSRFGPELGRVGCKELWAENYFVLPRENENVFEIFWL
jgi:hypothetical protein